MVVCPSHVPLLWHTLMEDPIKLYPSLHTNKVVELNVVVIKERLPLAGAGNWLQSTTIQNNIIKKLYNNN